MVLVQLLVGGDELVHVTEIIHPHQISRRALIILNRRGVAAVGAVDQLLGQPVALRVNIHHLAGHAAHIEDERRDIVALAESSRLAGDQLLKHSQIRTGRDRAWIDGLVPPVCYGQPELTAIGQREA